VARVGLPAQRGRPRSDRPLHLLLRGPRPARAGRADARRGPDAPRPARPARAGAAARRPLRVYGRERRARRPPALAARHHGRLHAVHDHGVRRMTRVVLGSFSVRDDGEAPALLDRYYEAGGRELDLANVYGEGEANVAVGRWLDGRDDLVLYAKGCH